MPGRGIIPRPARDSDWHNRVKEGLINARCYAVYAA